MAPAIIHMGKTGPAPDLCRSQPVLRSNPGREADISVQMPVNTDKMPVQIPTTWLQSCSIQKRPDRYRTSTGHFHFAGPNSVRKPTFRSSPGHIRSRPLIYRSRPNPDLTNADNTGNCPRCLPIRHTYRVRTSYHWSHPPEQP